MSRSEEIRIRPVRVWVELIKSQTGQLFEYEEAQAAWVRLVDSKTISMNDPDGRVRTDSPLMVFLSDSRYGYVRLATGNSIKLHPGSRIRWNGRYYIVIRTESRCDPRTGRLVEVAARLQEAGKAASTTIQDSMTIDPHLDSRGVKHDLVEHEPRRDVIERFKD